MDARLRAHLDAGCDLVLACQPSLVPEALAAARGRTPCAEARLAPLRGLVACTWQSLHDNPQRDAFAARLAALNSTS